MNREEEHSAPTAKTYLAIDLKSFYASVECVEHGLDPLTTNLVVADESRTEKTIVLAVSPALKTFGLPGRPRLFEVVQKVREINAQRKQNAPGKKLRGASSQLPELLRDPSLAVSYLVAPPRMSYYMEYSTRIYQIYLRFVAPEDILVYSIDEVFMDITGYLNGGKESPHDFAMKIMREVIQETGITATAGIGTNLYLAKIAMDVTAKKMQPDKDGVRIAQLDEFSYREKLWDHRPLTDFWRVGPGTARKLEANHLYTMGDVAFCSLGKPGDLYNPELLHELFGVNAELLIDHAWGWEPCTIRDAKQYQPESNSLGSGQVLMQPYPFEKARIVVHEMAEQLALDLVEKHLVTDQLVLTVGYDVENLTNPQILSTYHGEITTDRYGRSIPKHGHGTENLAKPTSSARQMAEAALRLYDRVTNPKLLVRRLNLTACRVVEESTVQKEPEMIQLSLFDDPEELDRRQQEEEEAMVRERKLQETMLNIKKKFGKNAILKGLNLEDGATARERNAQIGGHKA